MGPVASMGFVIVNSNPRCWIRYVLLWWKSGSVFHKCLLTDVHVFPLCDVDAGLLLPDTLVKRVIRVV